MVKKTSFLNRRDFLIGSTISMASVSKVLSQNIAKKSHIVILGGGWGGLSAAKTIRALNNEVKITLVEKQKTFISCPMSNWVIGQIKEMNDISFSYEKFIKNNNVEIIFDKVHHINLDKKNVETSNLTINFDKLILSPGIELDYSSIEGYYGVQDENVLSAWKAGKETNFLAKKVSGIQDNENIIITIPLSPYRCPPGPYERTSLIADYLKRNNINAKVIVLDANQKVVSKGSLFKKAWDDLYNDIIFYYTDNQIRSIDYKQKKVYTDFEEFDYKIANIIPNQKAPDLLLKAGLIKTGRNWAEVNPYDFTSQLSEDVFIIGDATDPSSVGSIPKSGYIAYSMGKVAGYACHHHLLNQTPPSPSMINTCYSLVSKDEGISVSAVYEYDKEIDKIVSIKNASGLSPERSNLIALNAWDWAKAIWYDMLT